MDTLGYVYYFKEMCTRFVTVISCCGMILVNFTHILQGFIASIGEIYWSRGSEVTMCNMDKCAHCMGKWSRQSDINHCFPRSTTHVGYRGDFICVTSIRYRIDCAWLSQNIFNNDLLSLIKIKAIHTAHTIFHDLDPKMAIESFLTFVDDNEIKCKYSVSKK